MDQPQQRIRARMVEALHASAVFGSLRAEVIAELADAVEWRQVESGEAVFSEGDSADSTIFVISGGLPRSRRDRDGRLLVYNQIHPGQSIGELAMILQQPPLQNVTAVRDSTLALLGRPRLRGAAAAPPDRAQPGLPEGRPRPVAPGQRGAGEYLAQTIAIVPLDAEAGAATLAPALVIALQGLAGPAGQQVGHLRSDSAPAANCCGAAMALRGARPTGGPEDRFAVLVFEAGVADDAWARFAIRQADQVVFVSSADRLPALTPLERQLQAVPGYALKRKHLVLMHGSGAALPVSPLPWAEGRDLEAIYPLRAGLQADAEHLARFLTANAVGVVLGGGGARGFAHLGVLGRLAEARIPVDLIGGQQHGRADRRATGLRGTRWSRS